MTSLPTILLILAAISTGAAVIAILVALRSARESRSAIFPIVREEESVRARRARISIFGWLALTALFLGGWLAALRLGIADDSLVSETQLLEPNQTTAASFTTEPAEATITPSPTAINLIAGQAQSPTETPAELPIFTTTPLAAATDSEPPASTPAPAAAAPKTPPTLTPLPPTLTPTVTPSPAPPTASPTSLADAARIPTTAPRTPAPPGIKMGPIEFATGITPEVEAVNPDDNFPDGSETIYAVYPFSGMEKGLDFTAVWYKDGAELVRDEGQWQYGDEARSYNFLVPRGAGLYKLELYVNDSVMATGLFEIR